MLPFELDRVQANVQKATTKDLLDRVTVYREGMEAEALRIIEEEIRRRGVSWDEVQTHGRRADEETLKDSSGIALKCSFCSAPAVAEGWGWHWMWDRLPVFPRWFHFCREHAAEAQNEEFEESEAEPPE